MTRSNPLADKPGDLRFYIEDSRETPGLRTGPRVMPLRSIAESQVAYDAIVAAWEATQSLDDIAANRVGTLPVHLHLQVLGEDGLWAEWKDPDNKTIKDATIDATAAYPELAGHAVVINVLDNAIESVELPGDLPEVLEVRVLHSEREANGEIGVQSDQSLRGKPISLQRIVEPPPLIVGVPVVMYVHIHQICDRYSDYWSGWFSKTVRLPAMPEPGDFISVADSSIYFPSEFKVERRWFVPNDARCFVRVDDWRSDESKETLIEEAANNGWAPTHDEDYICLD